MEPQAFDLLTTFADEAGGWFDALDAGVATLDRAPDEETVHAMFRAAHNLKGSSRVAELAEVGELAHVAEELFDRFRSGKLAASRALLAVVVAMTDALRELTAESIAVKRGAQRARARDSGGAARIEAPVAAATVRVGLPELDAALDLLGEIIVGRARLDAMLGAPATWSRADIVETHREQERNVLDLREIVTNARLVPLSPTLRAQGRTVRDLAGTQGKQVRFSVEGDAVDVDAAILEALKDPLTHVVRNAVDHGIERPDERELAGKHAEASLVLRAFRDGGSIVVEIQDDGRGFSRRKIVEKLAARGERVPDGASDEAVFARVFEPGFSTAEKVTAVSGRGVGMDVVRRNVEALHGTIAIDSVEGRGTTLRIRIPLTMALIDGFHVGVGADRFVISTQSVVECLSVAAGELPPGRSGVLRIRGAPIPCIRLRAAFAIPGAGDQRESVVVTRCGDRSFGLVVDRLHGEAQTVIKPLARLLERGSPVMGCAVLGDGGVALVLDLPKLLRSFDVSGEGFSCKE